MDDIIKQCLPTYEIVENLGSGVHGRVYRIQDRFKQRAVKIVPLLVERSISLDNPEKLNSTVSRDFHAIREYYEKIRGKGVLQVHDFHLIEKEGSGQKTEAYLVIVMEFCPENLQDHVVENYPLSPGRAIELMEELASTLQRLYRSDETFLVTDLKPSNLLLDNNHQLLIGDLGGLKRLSSISTTSTAQFSPNWSAPEWILRGETPMISAAVYSFGLVSYFIWEGGLPYEDKDFLERIKIMRDDGVNVHRRDIPEGIRLLINRCIAFTPAERPDGFDAVLESLKASRHPSKARARIPGQNTEEVSPVATPTQGGESPRTPPSRSSLDKEKRVIHAAVEEWRDPIARIVFIHVPGGSFPMGRIRAEEEGGESRGSFDRTKVDDFWIGKYPVTQGQWKRIMKGTPFYFARGSDYPAEMISWKAANDFAALLSGMYDHRYAFALPSEAQWEYAARSRGLDETYAGGDDIDSLAWYAGNSGFTTHAVGKRGPNRLGIHDMSGNVLEWCRDLYESGRTGPSGPPDDYLSKRSCRGGAYNLDARQCTTTSRQGFRANLSYSNLGFRVVLLSAPRGRRRGRPDSLEPSPL